MSSTGAAQWFDFVGMGDGITRVREPHVHPLLQCNIWHVAGRDLDLMIDTGLGVSSLYEASRSLFGARIAAVATHAHVDHIGGHHEFAECWVHPLEAPGLTGADPTLTLAGQGQDLVRSISALAGFPDSGPLLSVLPSPDFRLADWEVRPARVTRLLEDGDIVDLGDRALEVLHLPGHSPGSIGLWDAKAEVLFSGDAVYDGRLFDALPHSNPAHYARSMERLLDLPVRVVHAGHEDSFGRDRLREIARRYLDRL
jgi:glyoxylase-like metal-dependent hydrolase (beta-lactamase superfamily II)